MVKSVLSVPHEELCVLDTIRLTAHDRGLLKDMVEILTPFEEATDFVQFEKALSSNFVVPCIRGLKAHLQEMCTKFDNRFIKTLQSSMQSRIDFYESQDTFTTAALGSRFKLAWCSEEEIKVYKQKPLAKIESFGTTIDEGTCDSLEPPPPIKRSRLFHFMGDQAQLTFTPPSSVEELTDYLIQPTFTLPEESNPPRLLEK